MSGTEPSTALVPHANLLYATTMQLQVNIRHVEPDITAVILDGKIALGQESQYIEGLVRELLGKGQKKIILDISGVTYIDSAGLRMLTLSSSSVAAPSR